MGVSTCRLVIIYEWLTLLWFSLLGGKFVGCVFAWFELELLCRTSVLWV